ncbi:hypothetical protein HA466_0250770 [Hirschfeldia incana]|nr:hypothetical protein HA466_0250770 [Hirschfeldia incana]
MAKQTIELTVQIKNTERLRLKAMKVAGGTKGVTGVEFEKEQEDLTVKGEGVDVYALVKNLTNKVAKTVVVNVITVTPAVPE